MGSHAELEVRYLLRDMTAASLYDLFSSSNGDTNRARAFVERIANRALEGGQGGMVVQCRGASHSSASGTFTVSKADATVGDAIKFAFPDGTYATLSAVASGADVTAGTWLIGADSTAMGDNIVAAINGYAPCKRWVTGTNATGTVTLTAASDDPINNSIYVWASETTAAATSLTAVKTLITSLTSGVAAPTMAPSAAPTITIGAAPTADDTLRFGGVVLTWKASASGENQVTLNANTTTSAANLVSKINAHSILGKLVVATNNTNVVTCTWTGTGLMAHMTYLLATGTTPGTFSATSFATSTVTPTPQSLPTTFQVT